MCNIRVTHVPVDAIKRFNLVFLVSKKGIQVILPLGSRNAVTHIGLHIFLDIRKENINASQCSFCQTSSVPSSFYMLVPRTEEEDEVGTLVVGNATISLIRIFTKVESNNKSLVFRSGSEQFQCVHEGFVTNDIR